MKSRTVRLLRRRLASLGLLLLLGATPVPQAVDVARLLQDAPAPTLNDYRLFTDQQADIPNAGVTPYALNTPLFSDYALKDRFVYMPPGTRAKFTPLGPFEFPVGTTLIKTFVYPADFRHPQRHLQKIETRLLIHRPDGWIALTYVWNPAQTQAVLKRAGLRVPVAFIDTSGRPQQIDYAVPNINQCKECHSQSGAIAPIGLKARNLNGDFAYARGAENQISYWTRTGMLAGAPAPQSLPRTARWDDPAAPLTARARAYLDANCGHCHSRQGLASNSGLYLTWEEQDRSAFGFRKRPIAAGRGSGNMLYDIDPGHPESSILLFRMASTEPGIMMPQIGRSLAHVEGLELVRSYIKAMSATPTR